MHKTILLILTFPALVWAKGSAVQEVESVLKAYREAPAVSSKLKKTVQSVIGGDPQESHGDFYFSKGKLRMEMKDPEPTLLVYDGKYVWLESRFEEEIEVIKLKSNEIKRSDSVLAALFERKDILKNFKLTEVDESKGLKRVSFVPKDKKGTEVVFLRFDLKKQDLKALTYKDHIGNSVTMEFEELKKGKVPASKFVYKIPKGARVTEE